MSDPRHRLRWIAVACLAVIGFEAGCAGRVVHHSELPSDPIAVLWWSPEDGRRRVEMQGDGEQPTPAILRTGIADLGRVREIVGRNETSGIDVRYPGELVLLDPSTGEITPVPEAPPGSRPLAWSPDHRKLLFATERMGGKHQIYELDLERGEVRQRSGGSFRHVAGAIGPDDDVALARIGLDRRGELRADILLGKGSRKPVVLEANVAVRHIAFAPDGDAIAYVPRGRTGAQGGDVTRTMITAQEPKPGAKSRTLAPGVSPVFSPDGEWIIYSAPHRDGLRLRRMRLDGSGRTAIGAGVRSESTPAISPNGNYVVYVSEHNGLDRLFVKRYDGSGDRLLYDGGVVSWPVW